MPGKTRRQATCAVSRANWTANLARVVGRRIRFQFTSMPMPVTVARGGKFGDANASKEEAEILVVRLPR